MNNEQKWISVRDKQPEASGYYITASKDYRFNDNKFIIGVTMFKGGAWCTLNIKVRYWMPFPEAPLHDEWGCRNGA